MRSVRIAFAPRRSARSRHWSRKRAPVLDAYAAGVNSGLNGLGKPPFEYLLLRQPPKPWRAEDSLLVVLSMFITLQDYTGSYESTLATMNDVMPRAMVDFLAPDGTEWDSPIVGAAFSTPPIPGPDVYNLRARRTEKRERTSATAAAAGDIMIGLGLGLLGLGVGRKRSAIGSNNWAVSGRLTTDGARARRQRHAPRSARAEHLVSRRRSSGPIRRVASGPHRLIGVTLPGVPALVVGSNTHVAWGFTNTYADWSDLVLLDVDPQDPNRYRTPDGWRTFDRYDETIRGRGRTRRTSCRSRGRSGVRSSILTPRPAARVFAGWRTTPSASPSSRPPRNGADRRGSVRCGRTGSARRDRTWSSPTAGPHRLDDLRIDSAPHRIRRPAAAHRGPTARADGAAG